MPILKLLNEFARESVVLSVEPARTCAAHCTYCFAHLNKASQWGGKQLDLSDKSTFESILTRSYGPSYDPSHIVQYLLRNRYPVCFANTVEPFQDVDQANAILTIFDKFKIPLWFQTKTLNFDHVWPALKPFHDNSSLAISFPTPNQNILKRFEPGTPSANDRRAAIEKAASHGFQVTLGMAPYHHEFCDDPVPFLEEMFSLGISALFFDHLRLTRRQRQNAKDKAMTELATSSESLEWPDESVSHYIAIYEACLDNDIPIYSPITIPILNGLPNTMPAVCPAGIFAHGREFPYYEGLIFDVMHSTFYGDPEYDMDDRDFDDSVILTWSDALAIMESSHSITQPFTYSSMHELLAIS